MRSSLGGEGTRKLFAAKMSLQSPSAPKPKSPFPLPWACGYFGVRCGAPAARVAANHRLAPATGGKGPHAETRTKSGHTASPQGPRLASFPNACEGEKEPTPQVPPRRSRRAVVIRTSYRLTRYEETRAWECSVARSEPKSRRIRNPARDHAYDSFARKALAPVKGPMPRCECESAALTISSGRYAVSKCLRSFR